MEMIPVEYWIPLVTGLAGFIGALKPVRAWLLRGWKRTFGRKGEQLRLILTELQPNDGSSMKDSLNRIEERQNDFEAFLNAQLNIGSEAVFRTDAGGHVISNNRKHQHLTGFSMAQVEGDGWINVIHPDWRAKTHKSWHDAVAEGREFSEDIMYVSPDGKNYMVHVNAYRERDTTGKIRGYLGVVTPETVELLACPHIGVCAAAGKGIGKLADEASARQEKESQNIRVRQA